MSGGRLLLGILLLASGVVPSLRAQERAPRLEVEVSTDTVKQSALVRTFNLLEDTPWLTALRQGLPVQLRYRVGAWRSRDLIPDALVSQYEWSVVIRHQPLLDQFTLYRLFPGRPVRNNVFATPAALAASIELPYAIPLKPDEPGTYYYESTLEVRTLSDSDLDDFNRVLRGEIVQGSGGSLAERARRLALQLAGLPKLNLTARSAQFEYRK